MQNGYMASPALCVEKPLGSGVLPSQRPGNVDFDVFVDVNLNK